MLIASRHLGYLGAGLVVLLVGLWVLPTRQPPQPHTHQYLIQPGRVARLMPLPSTTQSGSRARIWQPHRLEFTSTPGSVEVYVIPGPPGVEEMLQMSNDLAAGHPPRKVAAQAAGEHGRIQLPGSGGLLGRLAPSQLVLVRNCSKAESEVSLVVHYDRW